jgi:hypothetical protein
MDYTPRGTRSIWMPHVMLEGTTCLTKDGTAQNVQTLILIMVIMMKSKQYCDMMLESQNSGARMDLHC